MYTLVTILCLTPVIAYVIQLNLFYERLLTSLYSSDSHFSFRLHVNNM